MRLHLASEPIPSMMTSSTNIMREIDNPLAIFTPSKEPSNLDLLKRGEIPSMAMMNKKDDKGKHCLLPRPLLKYVVREPLTRMVKGVDDTHVMIHVEMAYGNPICWITRWRKVQLSMSYAFSRLRSNLHQHAHSPQNHWYLYSQIIFFSLRMYS